MPDDGGWLYQARRELYRRFPVAPVAFSADGQDVEWTGPLDLGIETGEIAVAEREDGTLIVVQIHEARIVEHDGPELTLNLDGDEFGDFAGTSRVTPTLRAASGSGLVLGYLRDGSFSPVDRTSAAASPPFGELPLRGVMDAELTEVATGLDDGQPTIQVGSHRQADRVPASLRSKGFGRHTFMCGQSGSGKTYTTGVLFERLLANTGLPLIVIDPNSDHVHLGSLADPDDHSEEGARYRELAGSVKVAAARGRHADYPLCVDFSDLDLEVQALLLRLHPIRDMDDYALLRQLTGTLTVPYSVDDLAAAAAADRVSTKLALRIANLGLAGWDLWRRDGEASLVRQHPEGLPRCLVLDVGSLSRPDERSTVSLVLLSNRWARRRERAPMLLAVDEAHNVFPAASTDPLLQQTAAVGALIAGEGRKFGLHLFVATQRPGKVAPNVVSQCDNLILMRMNGAGDVHELETLFSHVPPPLLRGSTGFGLGQALFAGAIAPVPLLAQVGARLTREGGADVPATWARDPRRG
jgi:hypothetical protein